jgi:hypothetical protein
MKTLADNLTANLKRLGTTLADCPCPNKLRFSDQRSAQVKAQRVGGMAIYKCRCGDWHMTTDVDYEALCPICGTLDDEYLSCGCFEDIHYGRD